jgi:predicted transcriptional regulator
VALLDDVITISLLLSSAFFVALSIGLLVRYRRISQRISDSSDLGHDLWQALEQRMRKQDERILDMMGRMEVLQARAIAIPQVPEPMVSPSELPSIPPTVSPVVRDVMDEPTPMQRPESQPKSQESQESQPTLALPPSLLEPGVQNILKAEVNLDETQLTAVKLLGEGMKNTRQLTNDLKKSREHTARIMKELFDLGLVRRNVATKPFVYQLTDEGKRYITGIK